MKKLVFAVLCIFFLFASACSATPYRNDLTPESLAAECAKALAIEDIATEGAESLPKKNLPVPFPQIAVCYSANANDLDEIGIWKVSGENPRAVAVYLSNWLLSRLEENSEFYDSYIPDQTAKLRDAEVRVYGSYIAYAILSPEQKTAFFRFLENKLTTA